MEEFKVIENKDNYTCFLMLDNKEICKCFIGVEDKVWTISSWYTLKGYENRGFGKKTLRYLLHYLYSKLGAPNKIQYIWNGLNSYVFDWLDNNFGAISKCPIAIQKTQSDDDWDSHIYYLNTNKVLKYFEIT